LRRDLAQRAQLNRGTVKSPAPGLLLPRMAPYETSSFYSQDDIPSGNIRIPLGRALKTQREVLSAEDDSQSGWSTIRADDPEPHCPAENCAEHYDDLVKREPLNFSRLRGPPGSPPKVGLPGLPSQEILRSTVFPISQPAEVDSSSCYDSEGLFRNWQTAGSQTLSHESGSESNPFKYDQPSYSIFLRSLAEKEVSAALRQLSGSEPSRGAVGCNRMAAELDYDGDEEGERAPNVGREKQQGLFYKQSAIDPEWNTVAGVKIPVKAGENWERFQLSKVEEEKYEDPFWSPRGEASKMRLPPTPSDRSGGENDWETVYTIPTIFANRPKNGPRLVTATNQADNRSIRGDDSDFHLDREEFGSQERIIQHPRRTEAGNYRIRNLKGTEDLVFIPHASENRFNAFPQNSGRNFGKGPSRAKLLVRKISNPFQRTPRAPSLSTGYTRRKSGTKKFGIKSRIGEVEIKLETAKTGFRKRKAETGNELWGQTQANVGSYHSSTAAQTGDASPRRDIQRHTRPPTLVAVTTDHLQRIAPEIQSPQLCPSRLTSLPFPLVCLADAARVQAARRMTGEEDHTESNSFLARSQARNSIVSSKASRPFLLTHDYALRPGTRQIQRPEKAYAQGCTPQPELPGKHSPSPSSSFPQQYI
jgi:hypothetical protein